MSPFLGPEDGLCGNHGTQHLRGGQGSAGVCVCVCLWTQCRCVKHSRYKIEPEVRKEGGNHRMDAQIGNPGYEPTLSILSYPNTEFQVVQEF